MKGIVCMTKENDPSLKWGAPTSSYDDAKAISAFLNKEKNREELKKE
jgi:hypothetical protein